LSETTKRGHLQKFLNNVKHLYLRPLPTTCLRVLMTEQLETWLRLL